ncbi:class II fumarate hydratase [Acidihalobacter ferrooxydans]|uniref:Fumarate hydratase class II n=1 Tax=Acidihalobacter ferrooxydans TaxID=1765967 RepID=A0A1P8UEU1_9GAMM|nr:class II fumarate hydratase [Acidihalobacter ferrooxydans]APZ42341.1 aspartate ammonia-lyase [Acidihalobacter ferrooxydans]
MSNAIEGVDTQAGQGDRIEHDSMGELRVPAAALWGAQTQRAVENFPVSGMPMPRGFIRALGLVKAACAVANLELGTLDGERAEAIRQAALAVAEGRYDAHFPIDVFQTGSGTSSNMNANEVIAHLASAACGKAVHPNDHVNYGQSSNDVVPTALHVGAALLIEESLLPALQHLEAAILARADELKGHTKTGRTHLMDAMPVRLDQELGGWAAQVRNAQRRIAQAAEGLHALALGGTAVGTGVNAVPGAAEAAIAWLADETGVAFRPNDNRFEALSSQDAAVAASGALKSLATALMKIANDLRWMNSGPLAGLGEISLQSLQPGSSIMPGKVNPVIPEAVCQVAAQMIGNDAAITIGGQAGNFQLNVMLPLITHNLLQSIELAANVSRLLADRAIAGFTVNAPRLSAALDRNPILVTALNARIGYERGAAIAKRAYAEGRPVLDVACEMTDLEREELAALLDPRQLTGS